jgi:hypothetical protein
MIAQLPEFRQRLLHALDEPAASAAGEQAQAQLVKLMFSGFTTLMAFSIVPINLSLRMWRNVKIAEGLD